ncbi:DNA polymerase-3 subunit delta' [Nonlabens xylanidelens]|uniref:DNA polymerase-3 subunit delta n=2 Tax=Flavobacteriaceae TaxID=49546 RepID=A0A2S6IRC0_9FLAO|nr:DNA polymerase-3 subunit delta' [Nonlabens xylanidelens]
MDVFPSLPSSTYICTMQYQDVLGLTHIKSHLQSTVKNGRIAHAQMLVGPTGSGVLPLAIAYARDILCGEHNESCHAQLNNLAHPDLHFSFPMPSSAGSSSTKATSDIFLKEWRVFLKENSYGSLPDWYKAIDIEKKNAEIRVAEAQLIMKKLSLKSYEGGYKVLIIWGADKMNTEAANKLLKLIEEPPSKTIILLVAESEDKIINTIKSRCQIIHVPKLNAAVIAEGLQKNLQLTESQSSIIARQADGDYRKAVQFSQNNAEDLQFEQWFVQWVRTAFVAKTKITAINELMDWATTIASVNRETQIRFLNYCIEFFRQAMLKNYKAESAVYLAPQSGFDLSKFAPFVDGNRMIEVQKQLQEAIYHIERNANGKIVLTDLSIGMTRILHSKA